MSYQTSTIIQLREKNSQQTNLENKNGQFEININPPILVEDGDQLQLKSAFIDSVSSNSGKINITEEESNITLSFYHYIFNNDIDNKEFNRGQPESTDQPDGKHYFLCDTLDNAVGRKTLQSIQFTELANYGVRYWGDGGLVFNYTPPTQTTKLPQQQFVVNLPKISGNNKFTASGSSFPFPLDINGNFPIELATNHDTVEKDMNVRTDDIVFNTLNKDNGSSRNAHQFKISINIPSGAYDPDELARVITDKVSQLDIGSFQDFSNVTNGSTPANNFLLTTPTQFNGKFPQPASEVFYVGEDGQDFYRYTVDRGYLSGTSQFGLQFDEGLQKFKFSILNNPYYVDGKIAVKSVQKGSTGNFIVVNKNAGIVFSNLEPQSLWFDKMGFDPSILIHPTSTTVDIGTLSNQSLPVFNGLQEGVNITGSYAGLDSVINKSGSTTVPAPSGDPHGQLMLASNSINSTSLNQNIIFGKESVTRMTYNFGYYMIEVDTNLMKQDLRGKNFNSNKIQSIIGRYYSNDSYTSAYNEGSVVYQHKGDPKQLFKFQVRILQDDGSLPEDLGENNTIFLELVKNTQKTLNVLPVPLQDLKEIEEVKK